MKWDRQLAELAKKAAVMDSARRFANGERSTEQQHDDLVCWAQNHAEHLIFLATGWKKLPKDVALKCTWEQCVGNPLSRQALGYIDLRIVISGPNLSVPLGLCVEAKTYITSVGELLRQLRYYHQYLSKDLLLVVSPDTCAASVLANQQIFYVNPDDCKFSKYSWRGEVPALTAIKKTGSK